MNNLIAVAGLHMEPTGVLRPPRPANIYMHSKLSVPGALFTQRRTK
jgi:hypothetical protein